MSLHERVKKAGWRRLGRLDEKKGLKRDGVTQIPVIPKCQGKYLPSPGKMVPRLLSRVRVCLRNCRGA